VPTVLVTGASTGIGEATALRLAARGATVYGGVRRAADGARLEATSSGRVRWLELDVTRADQIRAAAERLTAELGSGGLDGLVNNAGIALGGPLEFVPAGDFRLQLEVNVVGLLAVTQAVLPLLRRARGRIVNIGSIAGRSVTPFVVTYCASKHAVEALTDGLRLELADAGIKVSLIEPGSIRTPIWEKGLTALARARDDYPAEALERYGPDLAVFGRVLEGIARRIPSPDEVVDAVIDALEAERPRIRYVIGRDARIQARLPRFLPDRANDALLRFALGRLRKRLG
jgi:NAD(P)-dependent dehydrogenase (short-subunit alcohol dehydrogenase family)